MSIKLFDSCCGVGEYNGTYGTAQYVLESYARQRGTTGKHRYTYPQHTFVVMTFTSLQSAKNFSDLVRKKKVGRTWRSLSRKNINHFNNWYMTQAECHGAELVVLIYAPDHAALTKYVQNTDPNYKLGAQKV